ncbi:MAG TPA: thiamine-binding protein [Cyclobacteriaceae bacterium]|jgi:uncharacterized protein (TIGR00106 family)
MKHNIHLALQIVPLTTSDRAYPVIDKAIDVIAASGLRYQVGAMETVIEGPYDDAMRTIKAAQQACFDAGAEELVVNIKLHVRKNGDVTFGEKLDKYS